ncbi:MAG TPA: hypothetical protein VKR23_03975 [Gaiellaceae bacterium]|nr:hypothetical protein [Gaiellaceae bacterium]
MAGLLEELRAAGLRLLDLARRLRLRLRDELLRLCLDLGLPVARGDLEDPELRPQLRGMPAERLERLAQAFRIEPVPRPPRPTEGRSAASRSVHSP